MPWLEEKKTKNTPKNGLPGGAKELSTQGFLCVWNSTTQDTKCTVFTIWPFYVWIFVSTLKPIDTKTEECSGFVRKRKAPLWEFNTDRMWRVCVWFWSQTFYHRFVCFSLIILWACAFYSVFLSKCNTIFKVPYMRLETAYTFLLGLGLDCCSSPFCSPLVCLCQCHESSYHLMSPFSSPPPPLLCVVGNCTCDVLILNSWLVLKHCR